MSTFITETNDLFLVTKSSACNCFTEQMSHAIREKCCGRCKLFRFKLYKIDLDLNQSLKNGFLFNNEKPIFEYTQQKDLVAFHVRASH